MFKSTENVVVPRFHKMEIQPYIKKTEIVPTDIVGFERWISSILITILKYLRQILKLFVCVFVCLTISLLVCDKISNFAKRRCTVHL